MVDIVRVVRKTGFVLEGQDKIPFDLHKNVLLEREDDSDPEWVKVSFRIKGKVRREDVD